MSEELAYHILWNFEPELQKYL